jgi:metal-responsive CopG/Arc/MetJ family transcriptional regulator
MGNIIKKWGNRMYSQSLSVSVPIDILSKIDEIVIQKRLRRSDVVLALINKGFEYDEHIALDEELKRLKIEELQKNDVRKEISLENYPDLIDIKKHVPIIPIHKDKEVLNKNTRVSEQK